MTAAIEVSHLTKRFGKLAALDDVSLSIEQGVITGLLGRNGAGKTVLMSLLTAQEWPTSGTISVFGRDPAHSPDVLGKISFIRDNQRYPSGLKVGRLFRVAAFFHEGWDQQLADRCVQTFSLSLDSDARKLSRGQLSALGATIGLASRAPITFFDEPYLGMDATARVLFYDLLLSDYAEHPRTVLLSTHLIDEMEPLLERVIVLDHGRVRRDAGADELRQLAVRVSGAWSDLQTLLPMALSTTQMGRLGSVLVEDTPDVASLARRNGLNIEPVSLQELVAAYGMADHLIEEGALS
ncbi:MAG: ABC transporter ATP-binding protein [Propionibacteriaceae bacterium]|nr:ABC transporter ATP-binding protein [Propionibacteriaceae bacterium]